MVLLDEGSRREARPPLMSSTTPPLTSSCLVLQGSAQSWEPPPHLNSWAPELDATWQAANATLPQLVRDDATRAPFTRLPVPLAVVIRLQPPRAPLAEKKLRRLMRARCFREQYPAMCTLSQASPAVETDLLRDAGGGAVADNGAAPAGGAASFASDALSRQVIAHAIAVSPGPWLEPQVGAYLSSRSSILQLHVHPRGSPACPRFSHRASTLCPPPPPLQAESTWRQLAFAMLAPDPALRSAVRSQLTAAESAPAFAAAQGAHPGALPSAVACLLGAGHVDLARTAASLAVLLDKHPAAVAAATDTAGGAGGSAKAGPPHPHQMRRGHASASSLHTLARAGSHAGGGAANHHTGLGPGSVLGGPHTHTHRGLAHDGPRPSGARAAVAAIAASLTGAGAGAVPCPGAVSAEERDDVASLLAASSGADVLGVRLAEIVLARYPPGLGRSLWAPSLHDAGSMSLGVRGSRLERGRALPSPRDGKPLRDWVPALGE